MAETTGRLRLVTINTAKGDGPYRRRLELLAAGLAELAPDVVLLQEALATPDGALDTAAWLGDRLGLAHVSAPARPKRRLVEGRELATTSGLALLSAFPLRRHERLPLPSDPVEGERFALLAEVVVGQRRLLLVNLHLAPGPEQGAPRGAQLAAIVAHPWLAGTWDACLLGGDFNLPAAGLPPLLVGLTELDVRDAYPAGGGREPRATCPADRPPATGRCIDLVVSLAPAPGAHPGFTESAVVLDRPGADGVLPSDHRGVATTLVWAGSGA